MSRQQAVVGALAVLPGCSSAALRIAVAVLAVALALAAAAADTATTQQDLSDYLYEYDELPRPHLRAVRASSHIQHVPADAPRDAAAGAQESSSSSIQRVPPRLRLLRRAAAGQTETPPPLVDSTLPEEEAVSPTSPVPEPQAHTELSDQQPTGTVASDTSDSHLKDSAQTSSKKAGSEDMETANFFWGLGPVYPHLYVYRRIPHLVPLPGWNPYHSYYLSHPQG